MTLSHLTYIERPQNVTIFVTLRRGGGGGGSGLSVIMTLILQFGCPLRAKPGGALALRSAYQPVKSPKGLTRARESVCDAVRVINNFKLQTYLLASRCRYAP
jgi:hypothetical protein